MRVFDSMKASFSHPYFSHKSYLGVILELTLWRPSLCMYGHNYKSERARLNAKPQDVMLFVTSLANYKRYILIVFCFNEVHVIRAWWSLRVSAASGVKAVGAPPFTILTFTLLRIEFRGRELIAPPTKKLYKAPPVRDLKMPKCRGSRCTKIKPSGRKVTTFRVQYFH